MKLLFSAQAAHPPGLDLPMVLSIAVRDPKGRLDLWSAPSNGAAEAFFGAFGVAIAEREGWTSGDTWTIRNEEVFRRRCRWLWNAGRTSKLDA